MKTNAALFLAAVARMATATDGVTGKLSLSDKQAFTLVSIP